MYERGRLCIEISGETFVDRRPEENGARQSFAIRDRGTEYGESSAEVAFRPAGPFEVK